VTRLSVYSDTKRGLATRHIWEPWNNNTCGYYEITRLKIHFIPTSMWQS